MAHTPVRASTRWSLPLIAVLVLTAAVNAPQLTWPFMTDDWNLLKIMEKPGAFHAYTYPAATAIYRPVSWGFLSLGYDVIGLHPVPFHVIALAFVLAATGTIYLLARRLGLREGGAALAALAFGVHPAMAWGVSWFCCIGSPMGEFFGAQALLRFLRPNPTKRQQGTGLLFFVLAVGSHETFSALVAVAVVLRFGSTLQGPAMALKDRLLYSFRGLYVSWVVIIGWTIQQTVRYVQPPPPSPYRSSIGWHIPGHMARLLEEITGIPLYNLTKVGTTRVEVAAGLVWVVLLAMGYAAWRARLPYALVGFVAAIPGTIPVAVLTYHTMDPYYLEVALLPFSFAIGSIGQLLLDALPGRERFRLAVPLALAASAVGAVTMVSDMDKSLLGYAKTRQTALLNDARAKYGAHLPAEITVNGVSLADRLLIYNGALYQVAFHDPTLKVVLNP